MPAKKNVAAKADGGPPGKRQKTAKQAQSQVSVPKSSRSNENFYAEMKVSVEAVMSHEKFNDIVNADPLGVNEGFSIDKYSVAKFQKAMAGAGTYLCGVNLFWLQLLYSPCSDVPMNPDKIQE